MDKTCLICDRVTLALQGKNEFLIHEFKNSYFVLGDHQYFKGYSLLLFKTHVREMHELEPAVQQELFREVMTAGKAVFEVFHPWKMNYGCYGNAEEHVHWHIFPRYEEDPDHRRNPWLHSPDFKKHATSPEDRVQRIAQIKAQLAKAN